MTRVSEADGRGKTSFPESRDSRWLYYALGGGTGHLMRGLALARRAARRGIRTRILSNSPRTATLAELLQIQMPEDTGSIEIVSFPSDADRRAITRYVAAEFCERPAPHWLLVDTFPRGLAGELLEWLPAIEWRKALVHRDIEPAYVDWADLATTQQLYDIVFAPGERGPLADLAADRLVFTAPWLICGADELLPPPLARAALMARRAGVVGLSGTLDAGPLIVVSGSGRPAEALTAATLAAKWASLFASAIVRFVSLDPRAVAGSGQAGTSCWPLMRYLQGVDLVVGAGGYHTVYETRAVGTPLIAIGQPRQYDRQQLRLRSDERVESWSEAEARLAAWIQNATATNAAPAAANARADFRGRLVDPRCFNGAAAAVQHLLDRPNE